MKAFYWATDMLFIPIAFLSLHRRVCRKSPSFWATKRQDRQTSSWYRPIFLTLMEKQVFHLPPRLVGMFYLPPIYSFLMIMCKRELSTTHMDSPFMSSTPTWRCLGPNLCRMHSFVDCLAFSGISLLNDWNQRRTVLLGHKPRTFQGSRPRLPFPSAFCFFLTHSSLDRSNECLQAEVEMDQHQENKNRA